MLREKKLFQMDGWTCFSCNVKDKKYVIIIENKIFAVDQYEQMDRYVEFTNQCSADIRKVFT